MPPLRLARVDPHVLFPARELARATRHDRVLDWLWVGETALQLAVLVAGATVGAGLVRRARGTRLVRAVGAGVAVLLLAWLAALPLHVLGHAWQRRYGLTHEGYGGWLLDQLRAVGLVLAVAAAAAVLLGAIARRLGRTWWPVGAATVVLVGAVSVAIAPLAAPGGTHPLRDRALAREIDTLARHEGVGPPRVVVERASKRTTLANAEAVGLGPTERIVLWDTLFDGRYSRGEIRFVAAHELAHIQRRHIWKGIAWLALFAVPGTWLLSRVADPSDPAQVPRAVLFVVALELVLLPVTNAISRRYEQEADWIALRTTRDPGAARALFVRFAEVGLERPQPPAWSHVLLDEHPTFLQRIELAEASKLSGRADPSPGGPGSP